MKSQLSVESAVEQIKFVARQNAIISDVMGINVQGEDPTREIQVTDATIFGAQARSLYRGLDVVQRVIDAPAQDALRSGFEIKTNFDDEFQAGKLLKERLENLSYKTFILQFLINTRLYSRGTIVFPVVDELGMRSRADYAKELSLSAIQKVLKINVIPEDFISYRVQSYDPLASDYGELKDLTVHGCFLHPTRVFFFAQNFDPLRQRGLSVLERVRTACLGINIAEWTITQLLLRYRALIVRYPPEELGRVKLGERYGLKQKIVELMNAIKMQFTAKSVVGVPGNYEFEYLQTSFTGLNEATEYLYEFLSTVTRVPQNIFRGSARGELASSEKDQRDYYELVQSEEQKNKIEPLLLWLIPFLAWERSGEIFYNLQKFSVSPDELSPQIVFNPMQSVNPISDAQIKMTKAQYYAALASGGLFNKEFLQNEALNDLFPHVDKEKAVGFDEPAQTSDPLGIEKQVKEKYPGVWQTLENVQKILQ